MVHQRPSQVIKESDGLAIAPSGSRTVRAGRRRDDRPVPELQRHSSHCRAYLLPPDANSLLSVADHCLRSRNYVNLIIIDKQAQLQWLDIDAAKKHCADGASTWTWASTGDEGDPDVVLASAGDIPTLETIAAAAWLRAHVPALRVRVVNVVDLMALPPADVHPHGLPESRFVELFTENRPVIFAFHGYQRAIHEIVHGRPNTSSRDS